MRHNYPIGIKSLLIEAASTARLEEAWGFIF